MPLARVYSNVSCRGKAQHKEYNVAREEDMRRFRLFMFDVGSEELKQRMREHPRVKKVYDETNVGLKDSDYDSDRDIKD